MNPSNCRCLRAACALLVSGCLVPAVAACHTTRSVPELTGTTAPRPPEAKKSAPLLDADIAQAIQRHFQDVGPLRSEHLQVSVTNGVAMVSGSVGNLLAKERAIGIAETVRGVRSVVDQVAVVPVTRTDAQLGSDVSHALQRDPTTRSYTIATAAKDGKVTLSGTADSWQQKNLFTDVAAAVPGVKSVDNGVAVHYVAARSESEIAADVQARIANDVWLDGSTFTVTVTGKTVRVRGVAASVAQKARARSDGWVAGVDAVDDGGVTVDWSAHDDQKSVTDFPVKSDPEIQQAVHAAFLLDPRLKTLMPQVTVHGGQIVLSGMVDSPKARSSAEADARDTVGVWNVRDEALVLPAGKPTDVDIERGAKRVLSEDLFLTDGKGIQVSSAKGKVALKGTIASGFERFDAIADVGSVPGVAEVDDDLVVNRSPAQIKASIEDRLFWDPMVERDLVQVEVAPDGVATLTGTLNAWSEMKAAADDALSGGAARVVSLLKLKNHPEVVVH